MPNVTTDAQLRHFARRLVDADALALAIVVLSDGWTLYARLRLVRLTVAAAANNDGSRLT
jgi:hypothetical protein